MKKLKILKAIIFCLGVAVTLNGIVLSFTTNINTGNFLTLILGALLVLSAVLPKEKILKIPKIIKLIFVIGLAITVVSVSFLLTFGVTDNVSFSEDAVIVLGAGIHGETPSRILRERLDVAIDYYNRNNDVLIIVSGGRGPQEDITEALAMERYLLNKGIPATAIIKEEGSTSTSENFKNSKQILEKQFGTEYSVAFISNEYHIYRAKGIAENNGLKQIKHLHSNTPWYSVLPGTLREILAVIKFWIFGS